MWFVILGVALAGMKLAEFGPVATWSWFIVLAPFALAVAWWGFADSVGLTQRRAMKKMDDRVAERRNKALEALGIDTKRERKLRQTRDAARRAAADNPAPPPPPPIKIDPERPAGAPPKQGPRT